MNKIFKGWGQHNREGSKEEGRWLFTDEMVEDLLEIYIKGYKGEHGRERLGL